MVTVIKKGTPKEEIKKQVQAVVSKSSKKGILEYAGKLKITFDPLEFQREMRHEWS